MNQEECFQIWAPEGAAWSDWAKPVVFAHLESLGYRDEEPDVPPTPEFDWIPAASESRAVVVDLPGPESVVIGLALAARGCRPVPLFNGNVHVAGVVDVQPIARYLWRGSALLRRLDPGPQAPPAFMLDSNRMSPVFPPLPGMFDNRWIVLPQDFPSGVCLQSRGITSALLINKSGGLPGEDLSHVLLRWKESGVRLEVLQAAAGAVLQPLDVRKPSLFRRTLYRVIALSGLRRSDVGGFGGTIPEASSHFGAFG